MNGIHLIREERARQIQDEGYKAEDDARQDQGQIALAAACYATPVRLFAERVHSRTHVEYYDPFPWPRDKRKAALGAVEVPDPALYTLDKRIDLLVKAGALIAAEIDRLIRVRVQESERRRR